MSRIPPHTQISSTITYFLCQLWQRWHPQMLPSVKANKMLTGCSVFIQPHTQWSWMWITINFMIWIFENRISNKPVTFLLNAAEPLQRDCVWSPDDVSLVIVNLSPLFSAGCCEGNRRACAEVVRSPAIPSNKALWDLHEHCCKYSQAVCTMRELATFRGGRLTRQVWTFTVIE